MLQGVDLSGTGVVLILACGGRWAAQAFIDAGAPRVICVDDAEKVSLSEAQSFEFEHAFYDACVRRNCVMCAVDEGQRAVDKLRKMDGDEASPHFVLLPTETSASHLHGVVVFDPSSPCTHRLCKHARRGCPVNGNNTAAPHRSAFALVDRRQVSGHASWTASHSGSEHALRALPRVPEPFIGDKLTAAEAIAVRGLHAF